MKATIGKGTFSTPARRAAIADLRKRVRPVVIDPKHRV